MVQKPSATMKAMELGYLVLIMEEAIIGWYDIS
jgi:hypothetical protein